MVHRSTSPTQDAGRLQTPLYSLHENLKAKFVTFAGYAMPVEYPTGMKREHLHTRSHAGLFDISHMGQIALRGDDVVARFESLVPSRITTLAEYRQRYTVLTNENGGIIDDIMVTRLPDGLFVVANAAFKHEVLAYLRANLGTACTIEMIADRALVALQGPAAAKVVEDLNAEVGRLRFLQAGHFTLAERDCLIHRCGYTGEDGFEIAVADDDAEKLVETLLMHTAVELAGLGARDTLRLEAGLCLSGQDFDDRTSPIEAGLGWLVNRPEPELDTGTPPFPGAAIIFAQRRDGVATRRVGVRSNGRALVRGGTTLRDAQGLEVGKVTSGGYGATVRGPVAMGYVPTAYATSGTELEVVIRGRSHTVTVTDMPFVPHRYVR